MGKTAKKIGAEEKHPLGKRRTVLAVDDDPAVLTLITLALNGSYTIHHALNATEARERLGRIAPDLFILNDRLGDEDGLTLLAEFRQVSTAPALLITGHGSEAVAVQALHLRANAYMQKPFTVTALRTQVAALLAEGPRPEHLAERAQQVIDGLAEGHISAADVARRLGVSPRSLLFAFRARFGRTPTQYLRDVRLRRAQQLLLTTDLSIAEVAIRTGFRDASYFDRAFKKRFSVTPLIFRRTHVAESSPDVDVPQTEQGDVE